MNYKFKHLKSFTQGDGRVGVSFFYNGKRYRYYNTKIINLDIQPNQCGDTEKYQKLDDMFTAFKDMLEKGWRPTDIVKNDRNTKIEDITLEEATKLSLQQKLAVKYSFYYIRDLKKAATCINGFVKQSNYRNLKLSELDMVIARELLQFTSSSARVQFNFKIVYSALLGEILTTYNIPNPFKAIKLKKQEEVLHKPIKNVKSVFEEISNYNAHLHICCLIAYGCLLRPHREIRNLKWCDFSDDMSYISLSGSRNKGKRNRIVPIPEFVKEHLSRGEEDNNIFSNSPYAYNEDYFKTLWSRYKKKSKLLKLHNTLYSFRHTGAINVYERTGSLTKLQQVMGHSTLQVTLTYLRGLEVKHLSVTDMPEL